MKIQTYESKYKNVNAITIESEVLIAKFLPEFGGKMASLYNKNSGMEFLIQGENREYRAPEYDGKYVDAECSGFDDMFPTIDVCYYEKFPWQGIKMPDHGEVCNLSWEYEMKEKTLIMRTHGVRLPYMIEKIVYFYNETQLNIDYKTTNPTDFDMDFLWAAHPMIVAEEGAEIVLPYKGEQSLTCVFSTDRSLGVYAEKMKWPIAKNSDSAETPLNITSPRNENGRNYKYYFDEKLPEGWCAYQYKNADSVLVLSFPKEKVPYLGIWVNEGSFHGFHSIALEPCTGAFDRIDIAKINNKSSVLKAKSSYNWYLNFKVMKSKNFSNVFESGALMNE